MSAQAISQVWDVTGVTAEERLILLWIANSCGQLGHSYCPEWIGMGKFIGSDFERACEVTHGLVDKGLLKWGGEDDSPQTYLWIVYDGEYYPPIDWTQETKRRSSRVLALIERDGPGCAYCDRTPINYHVDHFIPKARGGPDRMGNLVLACPSCNQSKKDKLPHEFLHDDEKRLNRIILSLQALHE